MNMYFKNILNLNGIFKLVAVLFIAGVAAFGNMGPSGTFINSAGAQSGVRLCGYQATQNNGDVIAFIGKHSVAPNSGSPNCGVGSNVQ